MNEGENRNALYGAAFLPSFPSWARALALGAAAIAGALLLFPACLNGQINSRQMSTGATVYNYRPVAFQRPCPVTSDGRNGCLITSQTGSSPAYGIVSMPGDPVGTAYPAGSVVNVVTYGTAVCEFDSAPQTGFTGTAAGGFCHYDPSVVNASDVCADQSAIGTIENLRPDLGSKLGVVTVRYVGATGSKSCGSSGGSTATTTTLMSSSNTPTQGTTVTFTANVAPSAATGTVTFDDGSTTLGTGTVSSGTATYSTSALAVGSHSITAVYGGNSTYATSTSSAVTVTVSSSGGGGGGTAPSANLVRQYKADSSLTGFETDATGNGGTLTATGTPTWASNSMNGHAGVTMDGTSYFTMASAVAGTQNYCVYWTGFVTAISGQPSVTGGTTGAPLRYGINSSGKQYADFQNSSSAGTGSATIAANAYHRYAVCVNSGATSFYLDGAADGTGTYNSSFAFDALNQIGTGNGSQNFTGTLGEVLIYATSGSISYNSAVDTYLQRWN